MNKELLSLLLSTNAIVTLNCEIIDTISKNIWLIQRNILNEHCETGQYACEHVAAATVSYFYL